MTNDDRPTAPGGDLTAPTVTDLPDKLRVHALAKLLGLPGKEIVAALAEVGRPVKGVQSSIDRDTAQRVVAVLLPDPSEPGGDLPEEIEDGALAAPLAPVFAPPLFLAPDPDAELPAPARPRRRAAVADDDVEAVAPPTRRTRSRRAAPVEPEAEVVEPEAALDEDDDEDGEGRRRRRRGRRGRGRGRSAADDDGLEEQDDDQADADATSGDSAAAADAESDDDADDEDAGGARRRRRRRRRRTAEGDEAKREDDPPDTVVHVREPKARAERSSDDDGVQGVRGSTRLEAKRQRRRDGREAGRRRPPILSESEFLARRESVERVMVVREHRGNGHHASNGAGVVQIGVLEDGVLVEHFVTSAGTGSLVGNVYLGRVQNVLPSMEAAFVDIGRGRNAVLYAGEVDWDAAGLEGKARKIEQALSSGDSVLVQVTKDPVGHKGARLTTQVSLPGRFLVYVPNGGATGISRKLPDTERKRLKDILRRIVPDDAGVIIRTAAEGVPEESLARDVTRLQAQWDVIKKKADVPRAPSPQLLYAEPDLLIKVVRDLFTEDFASLVVQGADAMDTISDYVEHVAPELAPRLRRHVGTADVFTEHRIDEQILKALDRKVWLPSGGYLVIDRTEAMTVIDVNTGKFTGSGGNLEETVTRNNLEAAEEVVRQLRLRDIGGIIVIDFIDMVLEANRDLVLRRLTECLGRDRTRHQVAEVTSLGLVQMTRKRVGHGLLEAFSTPCDHCRGRGVVVSTEPVEAKGGSGNGSQGGSGGSQGGSGDDHGRGRRPRGKDRHADGHDTKPDTKPDAKPDTKTDGRAAAKADPTPAAAAVAEPAEQPAAEHAESAPTSRRRGRKRAAEQPDAQAAAEIRVEVPAGAPEAPAVTAAVAPAEPTADVAALDGEPVAPRTSGRARTRARKGTTDPDTAAATAPPATPPVTQPVSPPATNGQHAPVEHVAVEHVVAADQAEASSAPARPRRRRAASRPAGPPAAEVSHAG